MSLLFFCHQHISINHLNTEFQGQKVTPPPHSNKFSATVPLVCAVIAALCSLLLEPEMLQERCRMCAGEILKRRGRHPPSSMPEPHLRQCLQVLLCSPIQYCATVSQFKECPSLPQLMCHLTAEFIWYALAFQPGGKGVNKYLFAFMVISSLTLAFGT